MSSTEQSRRDPGEWIQAALGHITPGLAIVTDPLAGSCSVHELRSPSR